MASITRFYALILSTVLLLSGVPGCFPNVGSFQVLVSFFELTLVHSVVHAVVGRLGLMITALASDQSVRIYTIGIVAALRRADGGRPDRRQLCPDTRFQQR